MISKAAFFVFIFVANASLASETVVLSCRSFSDSDRQSETLLLVADTGDSANGSKTLYKLRHNYTVGDVEVTAPHIEKGNLKLDFHNLQNSEYAEIYVQHQSTYIHVKAGNINITASQIPFGPLHYFWTCGVNVNFVQQK